MFKVWIIFFLIVVLSGEYVAAQHNTKFFFRTEKERHTGKKLNNDKVRRLSRMSNTSNLNEILDNICVVRIVGTESHRKVQHYIKEYMDKLEWTTEIDEFQDNTPNLGRLTFRNIIATLNPNAKRYVALACHYDSKYTREHDFVGATDSAVPCAQLMNLATVMRNQLEPLKKADLSLMFIFFDGEEAFHSWGPNDSIYGAKHLATKWHKTKISYGSESDLTYLDKLDLLVLLDLIGDSDPKFYSYFDETSRWLTKLVEAEKQLVELRELTNYSYGHPEQTYFQPYSFQAAIEDDHIPFLRKNVPILHLIPYPFPPFWHKSGDNRKAIDISTTENINKILRIFIAVYFRLNI